MTEPTLAELAAQIEAQDRELARLTEQAAVLPPGAGLPMDALAELEAATEPRCHAPPTTLSAFAIRV